MVSSNGLEIEFEKEVCLVWCSVSGREIPVAAGKTRDLKAAEVVFDKMTQNGSQGTEIQLLEGFKQHSFGRGRSQR